MKNGFYYDVDFGDESLSEKILKKSRKKCSKTLKDATFNLYSVSKADALKEYADNPYKTGINRKFTRRQKSRSVRMITSQTFVEVVTFQVQES